MVWRTLNQFCTQEVGSAWIRLDLDQFCLSKGFYFMQGTGKSERGGDRETDLVHMQYFESNY